MLAEALRRPQEAALDLHEGIVDPRALGGCQRWPETMHLLDETTGELVQGRCRATNLCEYCRTMYVVETVEMLSLDAMEYAPTIWVVLTAREHLTRKDCKRHLEQLKTAARRRWPGLEWFVQVEFQRRGALHLNLLVKGVSVGDVDDLEKVLVERWCAGVDAEPAGQWSGEISDGVGVVRYISKMLAHGLKAEQAPPIGWKGHRTSQTRGYLVRPASVMREEAREALREKRRVWKAMRLIEEATGGLADAEEVECLVDELRKRDEAASWRLVGRSGGRQADRERRQEARRPFSLRERRRREVVRLGTSRDGGRLSSVASSKRSERAQIQLC